MIPVFTYCTRCFSWMSTSHFFQLRMFLYEPHACTHKDTIWSGVSDVSGNLMIRALAIHTLVSDLTTHVDNGAKVCFDVVLVMIEGCSFEGRAIPTALIPYNSACCTALQLTDMQKWSHSISPQYFNVESIFLFMRHNIFKVNGLSDGFVQTEVIIWLPPGFFTSFAAG